MNSERVNIHIHATNQDTTAVWELEGNSDIWICTLSKIKDLKPFSVWIFSNVRIDFPDGRSKERMFYYDHIRNRLIQVDTDNLDFWLKPNKESEDKPMQYNVTITKEENRVIEEYWLIKAMKSGSQSDMMISQSELHIGKGDLIVDKKELDHNPTLQEIAQFLSETQADFVSVEHNYRFADLPFC